MKRINLLLVMLQMKMGGTERLIHNLARKLDRDLFNPSVAWFFGEKILEEFKDLDIPLYHVPKKKRIDFAAMRMLEKIISKKNIHLVNAHHFMPMVYSFYGSKIKNRASLVYTEHSEWEIEHIPLKWKIMGRYLLNRADASIGVSSPVSRRIQENFKIDQSKTFTIHNGVDLETLSNEKNNMALRKELGLSTQDKVIGIVANFRKVKNHIFLLQAFAELIKDYKDVKLLLIGQGFDFDPENSEPEIRSFVKEHGLDNHVSLLGYRSDVQMLLQIMDVFCLTSLKEGLPISLLEAMAAGLPLVGTDVEGIRDVIMEDKNGFLVQVDDVTGLKRILSLLLGNELLRQKLGQESKTSAVNDYALDSCIKHYQDLFVALS